MNLNILKGFAAVAMLCMVGAVFATPASISSETSVSTISKDTGDAIYILIAKGYVDMDTGLAVIDFLKYLKEEGYKTLNDISKAKLPTKYGRIISMAAKYISYIWNPSINALIW
ncbi:hypothetical protein [Methanothermococcus okinawensis]|uniref:Uncharacterized protein n=1 Tax=Methanothermococcus okinawensis (strain DSM 14208 / JCM 11175 / IH1) TaxID=647113 RepID=F8AM24_METOI|nr:hypothetical protein [Methanothermococcus okinawensis]AEH06706.1 hypothetical protein Metok_0729 [Methanothermococcus okinawensis IH1]